MKTLLCALIWAIAAQAVQVQAQAQDRGERYALTPDRCHPPRSDTTSSNNGDGRSGLAPARAAGGADNGGPPDNGFPPPARLDAHGQQLASPPEPPRPRAEQGQCVKSCEAGYAMVMDDRQQQWCQRIKPKAIRMSVPSELKPEGIDASFTRTRQQKKKDKNGEQKITPRLSPPAPNPSKLLPWQGYVVVTVVGADDKPLAGQSIKITHTVEEDSGGHTKAKHGKRPPLADLFVGKQRITDERGEVVAPATTDGAGQVKLIFSASELAGVHRIKAECVRDACGEQTATINVKVLDLERYVPDSAIAREDGAGAAEKHAQRHYLSKAAAQNLEKLIEAMSEAKWGIVRVNDAGLPWGGLFDIDGDWLPSHFDHSAGTAVDLHSKTIAVDTKAGVYRGLCSTSKDPEDSEALSKRLPNTKILWHRGKAEHFHVYLIGADPTGRPANCRDEADKPKPAKPKKG
ncbi:hypothetical protein [Herbaspirillum sp. RV1423]|uniref:hypothetical protein n=1 Tax=Herbaspirillum sp. RV1423 TaxID=1443993 RepID=UPI0012DC0CA0|nr:hypothetical protein [Herbaspirillum sp. RV1423]